MRRRMMCGFLAMVALLALTDYGFSTESFAEDQGLSIQLIPEKVFFAPGENVNVTIRLTNSGPDPALVNYSAWPYVFYSIQDVDGNPIFDVLQHMYITLPYGTDTIDPGETKDTVYNEDPLILPNFNPAWNQEFDSGITVPIPGYYQITGRFDFVRDPVQASLVPAWIFIGDYGAVKASFSYSPGTVHTDTVLTLNASASMNLVNGTSGLSYRWDWEGDGTWDTDWTSDPVANHQYFASGTYTLRLEVMDPLLLSSTSEVVIHVVGPDIPEFSGLMFPVLLMVLLVASGFGRVRRLRH